MDLQKRALHLYHEGWTPEEIARKLYLSSGSINKIFKKDLLKSKNGKTTIICFTGPSGSGKTTTLAKYGSALSDSHDLLILSDTDYTIGGWEKITAISNILGVQAEHVSALLRVFSEESSDGAHGLETFDSVLIDTSPGVPGKEFLKNIEALGSRCRCPVDQFYSMVIDIAYLLSDFYDDLISGWRRLRPREAVITRIDSLDAFTHGSPAVGGKKLIGIAAEKLRSKVPSIRKMRISTGQEIPGSFIDFDMRSKCLWQIKNRM